MSRALLFPLLSTGLAFAVAMAGCSQRQSGDQPSPSAETSQSDPAMSRHEGHDHQSGGESNRADTEKTRNEDG